VIRLAELARAVGGTIHGADVAVRGLSMDSRAVGPGDLFTVIRGQNADGREFIDQAVERGAVAVCDTAPLNGYPTLVVADPRAALAPLAAAVNGHPARELTLIGVTGTLGKTSTVMLVETALGAAGQPAGVIGSLGVRIEAQVFDTGMTTPEAPTIHSALRTMVDSGLAMAIVEVTSHALQLGRVDGLTFGLGVFTNLVPDEHLEFHPTPGDYVRTKLRFLDMLAAGAPLVISADDELVRDAVSSLPHPVIGVTMRGAPGASVSIERLRWDTDGSSFTLRVVREIPRLDGTVVRPSDTRIVIPLFGVQQVVNTGLAVTTALIAGVPIGGIVAALRRAKPIRRRMEIIHPGPPLVIDDTVGNPRSLRAVFTSLRAVDAAGVTVVFGIRGSRGTTINSGLARTLAEAARAAGARVIVTASADSAADKDRVLDEERECFLEVLRAEGLGFEYEVKLEDAVHRALEGARDGVVLLLGAGGMDGAADVARKALVRASMTGRGSSRWSADKGADERGLRR
jgi:UDP-N-acetylmuramoyl-L-alanyl-D-glutamate--2,6-diaminopimelate ligase